MDEMVKAIAKDYFSSIDAEEKQELLHELFESLEEKEKEEIVELLFTEFAADKKLFAKIKSLIEKSGKK